jgi:hypothetical protein
MVNAIINLDEIPVPTPAVELIEYTVFSVQMKSFYAPQKIICYIRVYYH